MGIPVEAIAEAAQAAQSSGAAQEAAGAAAGQGSLTAPPNLNPNLNLGADKQAQLAADTQKANMTGAGNGADEDSGGGKEKEAAAATKTPMVKDWRKGGKAKNWRSYAYEDGTEGADKDAAAKKTTEGAAEEAAPETPAATTPATQPAPANDGCYGTGSPAQAQPAAQVQSPLANTAQWLNRRGTVESVFARGNETRTQNDYTE